VYIGFLTNEYPPYSGGIGTSIRNLAKGLVSRGHQVTVLILGQGEDRVDERVRIVHIRPTSIPKLGWLLNRLAIKREINRLVEEEGLDIVEAPDWCGLSAGIKAKCPIVIRCNGSATYFGNLAGEPVSWSVRLAEAIALKGAAAIASVSKFTADETTHLFNLKEKIEIIPNCVPVSDSGEHQSTPSEENRVLYFGTIVRKKGVLDLPEIIRIVCEKNQFARFLLMGRDAADSMTGAVSTFSLFQNALNEQALARAAYLGGKSTDEVRDEIAKASICIFPSYAEALPLAWLEAMSMGKPVVTYNIGWASEVIESGVSGFLVRKSDKQAFAEAIQRLLFDPELRQKIGDQARLRVLENFSYEIVAERNIDWYQSVIDEFKSERKSR